MTIEILPARLANQIAAGEVVERPASVVKELVENSLDAGATTVKIDIEKGGSKRIRISDNGSGIVKDELMLALSRHATSKIKNLNDLEGISSLGFRGEALASISSVSRLTLTSKPLHQDSAWQACAQGRDMQVEVQPAAHPDGTTIDVKDLFFNTPARRKFLRTEKTEFTHIDEVIKRIALSRLDVTFILTHNENIIRQYRAAKDPSQYSKRVAQICGQRFIDNVLEVDCHHDNLHFSGWLAKPSFSRNQNDLCYSYVNGRMMRDKLINHAIRQAYADLLPKDTYPAFVLFLQLDYREVDVNVHPAKHEVRFHQGRYIHDFIYSVCQSALAEQKNLIGTEQVVLEEKIAKKYIAEESKYPSKEQNTPAYIKPLTHVSSDYSSNTHYRAYQAPQVSEQASQSYQKLMSVLTTSESSLVDISTKSVATISLVKLLHVIAPVYAVVLINTELRLLSLCKLEQYMLIDDVSARWEPNLVSQPLLLPIKLSLNEEQFDFVQKYSTSLTKLGLVLSNVDKKSIQIRQFPALLRHKDVVGSFITLIESLLILSKQQILVDRDWLSVFSSLMRAEQYDVQQAQSLLNRAKTKLAEKFEHQLLLNSVRVDLTSEISQL